VEVRLKIYAEFAGVSTEVARQIGTDFDPPRCSADEVMA
jgi:hypothetical protein